MERDAGTRTPDASADDRAARVERQLAVAQQITHIGSWEWDVRSNAVSWSDELYRIYGLVPQSCEISFETFLSKLHPEDRARVQQSVGRALEHGGRFAYPERILRPDGSVRNLETIGEVKHDENGRVAGLIGTCRDVTEELARDETIRIYADIVRNVQIGLSVWRVVEATRSASLVAFNRAAELAIRTPLAEVVGKSVLEVLPSLAGAELLQVLSEVAATHAVREIPSYRLAGDADDDPRTFMLKAFPLPGNCVGLAFEDVTAQQRARGMQAAEQRVLEMVAAGAALADVLTALVLAIEEMSPSTIGSILLLDPSGTRLLHGAAPHLPAEYNSAIDGQPIGPNAGSCGTAAFLRRAVIVSEIASNPLWRDYRDLAARFGLAACWSLPIKASDGRVLGTFAQYHKRPRGPAAADLELIERATHVARIAIERRQLDDQLRALSAHIEAEREQERTGIAREIHDELGQALTAITMDLAWIARRANSDASVASDVLLAKIAPMTQMAGEVIKRVRRISAELRPGVLDDLGLLAAIEWQAQEFEARCGIPCAVVSNLGERRLERNLSTAVFRIFQEALTNVARHANAERVDVRLECSEDRLRLTVRDDGDGISPEALSSPGSLGLLGVRERARRLGGSVSWIGAPGQGTELAFALPLRDDVHGDAS